MKRIVKFFLGFVGLLVTLIMIVVVSYLLAYKDRVFPGVYIDNQNVGNWTREEVANFIKLKSANFPQMNFIFQWQEKNWNLVNQDIDLKYNEIDLANRAFSSGRSGKILDDITFRWAAFWGRKDLKPEYIFDKKKLAIYLEKIAKTTDKEPVEGLFEFKDGRVQAFKIAEDGRFLEITKTINIFEGKIEPEKQVIIINLPVATAKPKISTERADNLGIKELVGAGESNFFDSIPERMYNIKFGAERLHGILIKPEEIFSFNESIGKVSTFSGYKQAYVIEKGKTVLGDGGGVCQISTTFFRAALKAGLPIVERVAHSYRVGYYEPPIGFDAAVYEPSPDFKFKNDTGKYLLVQTVFEEDKRKLTIELYGTSDKREVTISEPVMVSQSPAPISTYQDDPNLPKGIEKQIDTAHAGAKVYFTRKVTRGGKELIKETIWSNYIPWAAVILRGTKE